MASTTNPILSLVHSRRYRQVQFNTRPADLLPDADVKHIKALIKWLDHAQVAYPSDSAPRTLALRLITVLDPLRVAAPKGLWVFSRRLCVASDPSFQRHLRGVVNRLLHFSQSLQKEKTAIETSGSMDSFLAVHTLLTQVQELDIAVQSLLRANASNSSESHVHPW